jgi:hygromycin-B 4-O-kinase
VIRFSNHGDDFDRDAYAFQFSSPDLLIPGVTHRGSLDGVFYAVSQRVPGGFIDKLDRVDYQRTLPSLLGTLDALRTAGVTSSTGYGGWDVSGNGMATSWPGHLRASLEDFPDQRGGGWRPHLEASPTGADVFDRDVIVLERLLNDMPNVRHVIHSDLLNYNAFVRNHRVSGVIDWGCAMYGDFVYELAWFEFWSPWYPQWQGISVAAEAHRFFADLGADLHDYRERLLCYQLHIGLSHQAYNASIGRWDDLADVTLHTTAIADQVR